MDLTDEHRVGLESLLRRDGYDGSVSTRAQIVLWRAEGHPVPEIARMAGTTRPTVYKWIARYEQDGIGGLSDRVSTGRPPEVSAENRARILALTRQSPPEKTGLSHWSSREMARYLKRELGISVSHNFVAALWREHDLAPHRQGTFKLSTDPDFEEKVIDVVGLYLDPPMDAVVLSIDEKTQIQALDRTQPLLPMTFSRTEKRTHDYTRHGTTNRFAALNTATGEVVGRCFARRRTDEFLKFMDQVVATHDSREIHVVLDNLSTHSGSEVDKWLTKHPNVTFHFTPTGSSWLNQVEIWFGIITKQAIRRGTFRSLRQLINTINTYITKWNHDSQPFTWTATANEIITKGSPGPSGLQKAARQQPQLLIKTYVLRTTRLGESDSGRLMIGPPSRISIRRGKSRSTTFREAVRAASEPINWMLSSPLSNSVVLSKFLLSFV